MTSILQRSLKVTLPTVVSGNGLWLKDSNGVEYLDAVSGGVGVSCLGHGDRRLAQAIYDQLGHVAYAHGSFFTSEPAEALADLLVSSAPEGMERVVFCSGGSEAVETALKLVRQTWIEREQPGKRRIISRHQSYHGATMGALSISGNAARREFYAPMLFDSNFINPCYSYRLRKADETQAQYALRSANALESAILELGADTVAAFVAEPVVGATLGCVPAVIGYLKRVREICDKYNVLLVLDEVMCGMGRTGEIYACLADEVSPDIITLAKGLGGGYQPIGAVVVGRQIVDAITHGSGVMRHGYTYMGHPVACAAALAVQRIVAEDRLLLNVQKTGAALRSALHQNLDSHPNVGDIRGRGLFLGVELVADRSTKAAFEPALAVHAQVKSAALRNGLMVYPGGGTIDGRHGDHVLFAPAYVGSDDDMQEIASRFTRSLNSALEALKLK